MTNAITLYDETEKVAAAMVKSGYFQDSRDVSQAIVKILAGREMGFGAFASMTGVYIIQGRPSIGANLLASAVKRSGRYDYRVNQMADTGCEIEFFQAGKPIGRSCFTLEDAKKAGTKNLDKFPRNMLFARAMSNGVRWFCPDVFDGAVAYTPEELGATVNEDGDVIPGSFVEAPAPVPTLKPLTPLKPVTAEAIVAEITGEPQQAETPHVTYQPTKEMPLAKLGGKNGHNFPAAWTKIMMMNQAALGVDENHLANIIWAENIIQDTTPEFVLEIVKAHLEDKAAQAQS